jgi:hypothetical protein
MVNVADPYDHNFGFVDCSCCFFYLEAPKLYSRVVSGIEAGHL